jgi:hypothetical protein
MSLRQRTTKLIARRHDLHYFKRGSRLRLWQWYLAAAALIAAIAWLGGNEFVHGSSTFSAGPMSSSHAVMEQQCELCHVPLVRSTGFSPSLGLRRQVPDSACLSCHNVAAHHPGMTAKSPTCSSCHREHEGAMHLAAVADKGCTQCHANLSSAGGALRVAARITNFARDHPEFRELRTVGDAEKSAAFALKFNHAAHLVQGLSGPHGAQTLQCTSCHQPTLDADGRASKGMSTVSFEKSCRSCHSLEFDTHIKGEAPHTNPADVRGFVGEQIKEFAGTHPQEVAEEIRTWSPEAPLPGRAGMPPPRTTAEWIANRTDHAEAILWRGKCVLCHQDLNPESRAALQPALLALPRIEHTQQATRWYSEAVFSHPAHQSVPCAECHAKAASSTSGKDVLMPSIASCRRCHDGQSSPQGPPVKAGHAESGCFLCHFYHGPDGEIGPEGKQIGTLATR